MGFKPAIAIMLCITGLPSLSSADNFFGDLAEQFKTKINKLNDEVNQASNQLDRANGQVNQIEGQVDQVKGNVNQAKGQVDHAKEQVRQSIKNAGNLSARPGTGFSNSMDVIGLRLGMTAGEAKEALQTYDTTMRIQELYSQLPPVPNSRYLHQILAISSVGEQVVIEFAPPPREPVIVRLMRTTKYARGARPTLVKTLQALRQKYGTPTMENNKTRLHMSSWLHDRTGNKLTSASVAQAQRCTQATRISIDHLIISQQQDKAMAECGASLNIQIGTGIKSDGLVGSLIATLSNPAEMVRTTQKTRAYINSNVKTQVKSVGVPRL